MPVVLADRVVAEPVTWLWPNVIPEGKLVILDGDPDVGKSLIALDLCARLSTGRAFPDGGPSPGPANALVLSAEDKASDTIVPRLKHLGADLGRVAVWQRASDDEPWPWRLPTDNALLDDALGRLRPRLAVIDPIMAFLDDSVLCASDQSVRRALAPLIHLADKHHCTLLMHRHLNKQGGHNAAYRGLGSIAFLAACRYAMLVGRDPAAPDRRVLAAVRSSLAKLPPSLAFRISAADGSPPTVEWLGTSACAANALLVGPVHAQGGALPRAIAFLEQFLADGPRPTQEVWDAAFKAGFSQRTVERAKKGLGLRTRQVPSEGRNVTYCCLRHQTVLTGDPERDDFQRTLDELEKKYPPPTPLDDKYSDYHDSHDHDTDFEAPP
ncbi:MAG TPA: AAA family ATPase [Planctomycetaceae bacterium]|nr:AAA family ATPase [Planctomycetaceae bacterium]